MNVMMILGILEKGLRVLPQLIDTGVQVGGLITRMANVAKDAKEGKEVAKSEIEALEADLDAGLAEFNSPLPPES